MSRSSAYGPAEKGIRRRDVERIGRGRIEAAGEVVDSGQLDENEEQILETIRAHLLECKAKGPLVDALGATGNHKAAREFALSVLSELGDQSALPDMIPLLRDPDAGVRASAAEQLALLTNYDFGDDAEKWNDYYNRLIRGRLAYEKEEEEERKEKLAAKRARAAKKEQDDFYGDSGDGDDYDSGNDNGYGSFGHYG